MAKAFKSIPGPRSFPLLGTLPYYLSGIYSFDRLHWNGVKKLRQFGPIVREEIVPGTSIVWLYHPDDIKKMFEVAGRCPARRSHLALEKYRLDKPDLYSNAGLLPSNGPVWEKMRKQFQFRPNVVEEILPELHVLADEFCQIILRKHERGIQSIDFLPELKKYFLESTVLFLFGIRIGALTENLESNSRGAQLIEAAMQTNENILKTDNGLQLWKYYETKEFKMIRKGQECIETVAKDLLAENKVTFPCKSGMGNKDIFTFVSDMLLAGIDTSAYTSSFLLYHLAQNPGEQQKLKEACKQTRDLDKFKIGKMALKESLRLNPISVGVGRISHHDAVFSGYHVPKGTLLVSQNQITCRQVEYFKNPNSFLIDRWTERAVNPYVLLPFGHGTRMCIGRRLAESSILVLINHLFRHLSLEWTNKQTMDCKSLLINKPDQPVVFKVKLD